MRLSFWRKKKMFEPVALSKDQLAAGFRVPEDHGLLQAVLHLIKAEEEALIESIVPGQPNEMRRDVTAALVKLREVRSEIVLAVENANKSAKGEGS